MEYQKFKENILKYNELDKNEKLVGLNKEELINELRFISQEKRNIQNQNNMIIDEYIVTYEKNKEYLNDEVINTLKDFFKDILFNDPYSYDFAIGLRLADLIYGYYRGKGIYNEEIKYLRYCIANEYNMSQYSDIRKESAYTGYIPSYFEFFDEFDEETKSLFMGVMGFAAMARGEFKLAVEKFRLYKSFISNHYDLTDEKNVNTLRYRVMLFNCVDKIIENDRIYMSAVKRNEEPKGELLADNNLDILEELDKFEGFSFFPQDTFDQIKYIVQFHLKKKNANEFIESLYGLARRDSVVNNPVNFFVAYTYVNSYLFAYSEYSLDEIKRLTQENLDFVYDKANAILENVKGDPKAYAQVNIYYQSFLSSVSNVLDINCFRDVLLKATVIFNKSLYTHTNMVARISEVIFDEIYRVNPEYFVGVANKDKDFILNNYEYMKNLMKDCAMFHDLGKYYCMPIVSNSSRNLTDKEFGLLKDHSLNFSSIYEGVYNDDEKCIRDCAYLHHLWHNEKGGYPLGYHHTNSLPFVNILSIADSLDAATDNIGRPYAKIKDINELVEEFISMSPDRYDDYVAHVISDDKIKAVLQEIITKEREDINYNIYR